MSQQNEHIEDSDSQKLDAHIGDRNYSTEFAVPDHFFDDQMKLILAQCKIGDLEKSSQFSTPERYFEDAEIRVRAAIEAENAENDAFFASQQDEILMRIRLENLGIPARDEFAVPEGYFENTAHALLNQAGSEPKETRVIPFYKTGHARMWMAIAAAASIAFLAVMIWPQESGKIRQQSFSELLEQTDLDENDLEYFATEEEYDELLLSEIELLTDTLVTDSLQTPPAANQPVNSQKDKKDKKDIKPKDKKKAPSFDDLTEEEILEFLLEEGGDDLLDDL